MNAIFCTNFMMIYEFSTRLAITSFDLQEYNQIFHEKGVSGLPPMILNTTPMIPILIY
jgi:hypothetical protein